MDLFIQLGSGSRQCVTIVSRLCSQKTSVVKYMIVVFIIVTVVVLAIISATRILSSVKVELELFLEKP